MAQAKLDAFDPETVALSRFARALAHPARIAILTLLDQRGEVPCMEVVEALPLSQPACSRHVAELRRAGLVKAREEGSRILLSLEKRQLNQFCRAFGATLDPAGC
jgi:DNA-binding transcriptional ArsR family regulator